MPEKTSSRSPAFHNSVSENLADLPAECLPASPLRLVPGGAAPPVQFQIPKLKSSRSGRTPAAEPGRQRVRQPIAEEDPLTLLELRQYWGDWLHDCHGKGHSPRTTEFRADQLTRLLWFFANVDYEGKIGLCDVKALREFLSYVRHGHLQPGGRWGNPRMIKAVRPLTINRYWRELKAFYSWVVKDSYLARSPMTRVEQPEKDKELIAS